MDLDHGGLSSSERQRQTAAEIARKKVLAAYSSTQKNIKNLPSNPRRRSLKAPYEPTKHHSNTTRNNSQTPNTQPDWQTTDYQPAAYQRHAIYSSSTNNADQQIQSADTATSQSYNPEVSQPARSIQEVYDYAQTYSQTVTPTQESPTAYTQPSYSTANSNSTLKDTPINASAVSDEWKKYHSAWQDYYQNYYSDYYAKAAQTYIATEKLKDERIAEGAIQRTHRRRRLIPIFVVLLLIIGALFLQYNRLIFAPIMAYVSPDTGSVNTNLDAIDPTITETVSPEPRLIIPKLNIDVPVAFNISLTDVDEAMNHGVAHYTIPGANALPGQIGNLVITGHSAGDIYSNNPYKFIFSGLERLSPGDLIYVNYESTRYTYQMTGSEVVEPTDVAALIYDTDQPILTLITCTPLGTSRYRLLIIAEQISPAYDQNNIAPSDDDNSTTNIEMPANEPSFFENLWTNIFGH